MRVLFTNESPLIKYGMAEGFRQIGHDVKIIMGEEERLWGGKPPEVQIERLNRAIESFKPDFIFTEGYPGCDTNAIGKTIRKHKIPHVYWAIEDPVSEWLAETYAPHVNIIFTTTAELVPKYRGMGKLSDTLLFACNPGFHHYAGPKEEYMHDIVLVASNYSNRYEEAEWFVMPLVEKGYDIKIYGLWWDDPNRPVNLLKYPHVYGGVLPYEELPAVYSSAKIILGMNCDDTSITQTSMRPYEALACGGGLYLAHYTKAQQNIFGHLIEQVIDTEHTINMVNVLLKLSPEEAIMRAAIAQKFVYENHTYAIRAQQVIDMVNKL